VRGGVLPGGYFDARGRLHRDFELTVLTGRDEELLTQVHHPRPAALVTEALSRCVDRIGDIRPVPPEVARALLVADRQYLMLQLRAATFGDLVRATLFCPWPQCGERVSLEFSIADVPVEAPPQPGPFHNVTLSAATDGLGGCDVLFRLPTGADQEALSGLLDDNEAAALTALLARCVRRIGETVDPDEEFVAALPASARAEIEEQMRRAAPSVAQSMDARCTECGRGFTTPFDIQRFFLGELRTDGARLYEEVHYLAFHYHWAEREIMEMTHDRRQTYIDVLSGAIEGMNDDD
jgi:hypothetical protein